MSVAVVSGVPWAMHPKVFWSGYAAGSEDWIGREREERKKRWKMRELISFWKTSYMFAGYSCLNQNYLNFFLYFWSWAWILWFGDLFSCIVWKLSFPGSLATLPHSDLQASTWSHCAFVCCCSGLFLGEMQLHKTQKELPQQGHLKAAQENKL